MASEAEIGRALAVIGLSGRFPKSANVDQYWKNLIKGNPCISFFSDAELRAAGVPGDVLSNPAYVRASGFLEGADLFDAAFFNVTPREAELTDPQHRLFLECAWEALEIAGYDPNNCSEKIGVFGGCSFNSYLATNLLPNVELLRSIDPSHLLLSNDKDHLCTRVSYKLNLTGPSVTIQTGCSTSLVCVHFACQSLLSHECDIALAGGASIRVTQNQGYVYHGGGIASPDGCCRAFDAEAQGTVSGNGVGIVTLKRLEEALSDRDTIHAVIRGSAVNNDGATKVGYTAPSEKGQSEVIAEALAVAGVQPCDISYVEAHGTGTRLGDPIEVAALTRAFAEIPAGTPVCPIGSVKPNIGHLDAAAGIAGLIKVIQALKHQTVPRSIYFQQENPEINFAESPFYVSRRSSVWDHAAYPRKASVSSFGVGGTNAHLVVEEAPRPQPSVPSPRPHLLLLSARTPRALEQSCRDLADHLRQSPEVDLADVAYTRAVGRRPFAERLALCCENREEAISALDSFQPAGTENDRRPTNGNGLVFSFAMPPEFSAPGWSGLYAHEPAFRRHIEPHLAALANIAGDVAFDSHSVVICPAGLFIVEYALAQTLIDWGLRPTAMAGDRLGEYLAACLGGVLSVEESLRMVVKATGPQSPAEPSVGVRPDARPGLQIPYFSTTMGMWMKAGDIPDAQYWGRQVEQRAGRGSHLTEDADVGTQVLVTFGPREADHMGRRLGNESIPVLASKGMRPGDDLRLLARAMGRLWTAGIEVDWQKYYADEERTRVPLPTYPFEKKSYWIQSRSPAEREARPRHEVETARPAIPSGSGQSDALQTKVGGLWHELLGKDAGNDDDFFEAGGDSLTGARLISKINHLFQIDLTADVIFENSTIAKLALLIEEAMIRQIQKQQV